MISVVGEKLLPGGKVRIHWFRRDADAPFQTPQGGIQTPKGTMLLPEGWSGVRGYLACNRGRSPLPRMDANGSSHVAHRSDDWRAVTCPECMATPEFQMVAAETLKETDYVEQAEQTMKSIMQAVPAEKREALVGKLQELLKE